MNKLAIIENWTLKKHNLDQKFPADVPGDITYQLYKDGEIKSPYFGMNYKDQEWIVREDFDYETKININKEQLDSDRLSLCFYGVDTFSEIYFNGNLIGKTENMFLKYEFSIKEFARLGENTLRVELKSTLKEMDKFDCKGYFATFNLPRIFVRKAQCHFGWDWAPNLPGYGIWEDVKLEWGNAIRFENVKYQADLDGNVTFFVDTTRFEENKNYHLTVKLADKPFGNYENGIKVSVPLKGGKQFVNAKVENCMLWWPTGYGEANLYPFSIEIDENGKLLDSYQANCAFRTVGILETPTDTENLSFIFTINGKKVYVRGSNWVPIECFTGVVKDEKYQKLISLAKEANFNLLRVWGGGIYEKDIFYDICDKEGMLVWQDFMFACADIPEDDKAFVDNALAECEYQVRRLINHPSLIYWCGGNEKTGTYGRYINHGDFFCDNILHGLVKTLDNTRPYIRQSPFSYTDIGNDLSSGESHCNSAEDSLRDGIFKYRELVSKKYPSFVSECAVMGPPVRSTIEKMFPSDKLWPINEYWNDRFMDNPYASYVLPFAERENKFATELYGKSEGLDEFLTKAMNVHAEMLQAEIDFARSRKWACSGFLNWMFSDIWPSGTWAVVDYFLQPKQAYYAMKKCYAPIRAAFVLERTNKVNLHLFCDGNAEFKGIIEYGEKDLNGKVYWIKNKETSVNNAESIIIDEDVKCEEGHYLFAKLNANNTEFSKTLYSPTMWGKLKFTSDYTVKATLIGENKAEIKIKANAFVKSLYLGFEAGGEYKFSDNFIDVEAFEEKTIIVEGVKGLSMDSLVYCDFANPSLRHKEN